MESKYTSVSNYSIKLHTKHQYQSIYKNKLAIINKSKFILIGKERLQSILYLSVMLRKSIYPINWTAQNTSKITL